MKRLIAIGSLFAALALPAAAMPLGARMAVWHLAAVRHDDSTDHTQTTPEPVPYAWLDVIAAPLLASHGGDYEATAHDTAANGLNKVWECYVAGISPTNATETFRTVISWLGDAPLIDWEPRLSAEEEAKRTYTVYGRERLDIGGWTTPTNSLHRFFKVGVEMK